MLGILKKASWRRRGGQGALLGASSGSALGALQAHTSEDDETKAQGALKGALLGGAAGGATGVGVGLKEIYQSEPDHAPPPDWAIRFSRGKDYNRND